MIPTTYLRHGFGIILGFGFVVTMGTTYVINVARRHPTLCLPSQLYH